MWYKVTESNSCQGDPTKVNRIREGPSFNFSEHNRSENNVNSHRAQAYNDGYFNLRFMNTKNAL